MMNVAQHERDVYTNFDLESDVLYFRIGGQGLVSFHGRNYNRKKKLSAGEIQQLKKKNTYFQISSNCFINITKIKSIASKTIYFGSEHSDAKHLPVNRRKRSVIEQLFIQRMKNNETRIPN
ncbi:LytTR family transcriptional regulator DNA-binding domain-containing protein [Paenibacillus sp. GSMTC-2017]|uniref:LytTR family transcriptional regulator DNA-binding domain-containing protein n=1 Tax=Paenibacillus sp. GSMTC-2017 TaxID=2794350 RepID=UPI0018D79163|nr:LytTR family transcriptional regulator DNA-binding domain-containing protein [Paenibacillus sp. GSMTC-2017]MBH5317399.1 LytTR family transcriptional regulator DNA-binding domain-containing protein [Paenibacillus sp. GSMTC-2017]